MAEPTGALKNAPDIVHINCCKHTTPTETRNTYKTRTSSSTSLRGDHHGHLVGQEGSTSRGITRHTLFSKTLMPPLPCLVLNAEPWITRSYATRGGFTTCSQPLCLWTSFDDPTVSVCQLGKGHAWSVTPGTTGPSPFFTRHKSAQIFCHNCREELPKRALGTYWSWTS